MAVEDLEQFKEWDVASTKVATWQLVFDKVRKDYPQSHVLYKHAKAELEKAEAHLAQIQAKW